jgi:hypothetical protein
MPILEDGDLLSRDGLENPPREFAPAACDRG